MTDEPLSLDAISRIPDHEKVVALHLNREPTDSEIQGIFDAVWKIINEG